MDSDVQLREVEEQDLRIFFAHQSDPAAARMAAFPSRDQEAFTAHWTKILADATNTIRTVLYDGEVAGNIVAFDQAGRTLVGYWLGKEFWGRGVATQALTQFLGLVSTRPLYAHVAKPNVGSIRVLQKCGFTALVPQPDSSIEGLEEEAVYVLGGDPR